jgi:hypothetical protein
LAAKYRNLHPRFAVLPAISHCIFSVSRQILSPSNGSRILRHAPPKVPLRHGLQPNWNSLSRGQRAAENQCSVSGYSFTAI